MNDKKGVKKSDDIKQSIIDTVARRNPTKSSLCRSHGITWQTLKNWRKEDPAFDEAYRAAEQAYLDALRVKARNSLRRLIEGYEYETERTTYAPGRGGDPVIVQKVVTRLHQPPNERAIEFVLRNTDPDNFE